MSFYRFSEVASIVANRAKDVTEELVDAGRKAYCALYENHPAWIIPRAYKDTFFIFRAMNEFCNDGVFVPPPPPAIQFSGGQCNDDYYVRVSCEVELWNWTNFAFNVLGIVYPSVDTRDTGTPIVGPITSIGFESVPPCPNVDPDQVNCTYGGRVFNLVVIDAVAEKRIPMTIWDTGPFTGGSIGLAAVNFLRRSTIANAMIEVGTISGDPDICGDPPPGYAYEPPPTSSDLNVNIDVTNQNNVTNNYDVTVNTDINGTIAFSPTINVGGIGVGVDVTGVYVGTNISFNAPSGNSETDENDIPNGVREPEPLPEPEPEPEPTLVTESGGIEETVANIYSVTINITSIPANAKISSGAGAPRIIYAGWVEFKVGGDYLPRNFIDFDDSTFLAPEGATGYAVTIKQGYTASILKSYYTE